MVKLKRSILIDIIDLLNHNLFMNNIGLSIINIPREVVSNNIVLPNYNIRTIISFARTNKEYYEAILGPIQNLWMRRVATPSAGMTFFEFIGGYRQLFIDFERINNLCKENEELFKKGRRFSLILTNDFFSSIVRNLIYSQYGAEGIVYGCALPKILEKDFGHIKSMEAEIAKKKFERCMNSCFFSLWGLAYTMLVLLIFTRFF
ncbi:hypothetical protein AYO37_00890 [Opitutia bacterium SCGC AG-212-L18]|nr:hypothetical protein AYO37_00890 [Opitutae bacterium SCGC AG-212-L18]